MIADMGVAQTLSAKAASCSVNLALAFTEAQKVFPYISISVEKTYSIHIIQKKLQ